MEFVRLVDDHAPGLNQKLRSEALTIVAFSGCAQKLRNGLDVPTAGHRLVHSFEEVRLLSG